MFQLSLIVSRIKMYKTWGYMMLENRFRDFHCWPKGIKGWGSSFLIITVLLFIAPIHIIPTFGMNYRKYLFHQQFFISGLAIMSVNLHFWLNKQQLFDLIEAMSNFDKFGVPKKLQDLEKKLKIAIILYRWLGISGTTIMSIVKLFDKSCTYDSNVPITCNTILEYYVPFKVEPLFQTFIILLQGYTFASESNHYNCIVLFYSYSLELLVIRLEHITELLNELEFKPNEKRNEKFRNIILYHQHVIKLFGTATNFINKVIVPQRFGLVFTIIISATGFVLWRDISCLVMFSTFLITITICHMSGQRIINAGASVPEAIYNTNWYEADLTLQKDVLFFLAMSQRILIVELPLLGRLSHQALIDEYTRIFAWFNWIGTMAKKKDFFANK